MAISLVGLRHVSDPSLRRDHPGLRDYPKLTVRLASGTSPAMAVIDACRVSDRVPVAFQYNIEFDTYTIWCLPADREPKEA